MGARIAGIGSLTVAGIQLATKAKLTIMPSPIERKGISGQDRVHGFQEMPTVPYIEAEISLQPDQPVENLDPITDETAIAELADGRVFVLRNCWYCGKTEVDTQEGQHKVRFEGITCDEI